MKALRLDKSTAVEDLALSEVEIPKVKSGWVLIKVMAFGLNHSEVSFRLSEIDSPKFQKPRIVGIECVGIVADGSDTDLKKGDKVVALMGGMGRTFDGSYAEYVLAPRKNVFLTHSDLDWAELAAVPETYLTVYGSLFECLDLTPEDTLLIRAGASALGLAAITLAKAIRVKVAATVRNHSQDKLLKKLGVDEILIDQNGSLAEIGYVGRANKILDLIGAKTAKDSLKALKTGGVACITGTLGGEYRLELNPIYDIPNGCYLTGYYSNYPTQETMDAIFDFIDEVDIKPPIGKVYQFADVKTYSHDLEDGKIGGKGVVLVGAGS